MRKNSFSLREHRNSFGGNALTAREKHWIQRKNAFIESEGIRTDKNILTLYGTNESGKNSLFHRDSKELGSGFSTRVTKGKFWTHKLLKFIFIVKIVSIEDKKITGRKKRLSRPERARGTFHCPLARIGEGNAVMFISKACLDIISAISEHNNSPLYKRW